MADIELVIKIPEEIYKASQIIDVKYEDVIQIPLEVIANGTPLPKGHGDLIDADKMIKELNESIQRCDESKNKILKQLGKPETNNQIPLWMWKGSCKTCEVIIEADKGE